MAGWKSPREYSKNTFHLGRILSLAQVLLAVIYSELLTSPIQSWELMQNVKGWTRWVAKPRKHAFDSWRLKVKKKVFQKLDQVTLHHSAHCRMMYGRTHHASLGSVKCNLFLSNPLKAADGRCSEMVTWLQRNRLRWQSYKDMCSWTLLSLVNHHPAIRITSRGHKDTPAGDVGKHYWEYRVFLTQKPNYFNTPYKTVVYSPRRCGINNCSLSPQTCGSAAYAPFAQH